MKYELNWPVVSEKMFEDVDRQTDAGGIGVLKWYVLCYHPRCTSAFLSVCSSINNNVCK